MSNFGRRGPVSGAGRRVSPNSFAQRNNSNISVHSEHLWNMMQDIELFPQQIYHLLRCEQRNLGTFKKSLQRQKHRVGESIDSLKRQMEHNIDDMKISIFAELDRIYRFYMEKYATLKGQIMEIKRLKDELQINITSREMGSSPRLGGIGRDQRYSVTANAGIMKSMQKNSVQMKKYQMLNYIAELQRQKIMPLGELTSDLTILTQYENGFYQHKEFQNILGSLVDSLKSNLRGIYQRKYQFIREPQQICQREDKPVLDQLYVEAPQTTINYANTNTPGFATNNTYPNNFTPPISVQRPVATYSTTLGSELKRPTQNQFGEVKVTGVSAEQQNISMEWAQGLALNPNQSVKSVSDDIILCAVQVGRNQLAVGGKDGVITVYDSSSGQKVANLRGHKASICKLALVSNNGKKYLASGSDHGCSSIVLWDTNTWNIRMKIEYHKAAVTAILDLQDNRSLVSGSYDKTINVYNLNNEGKMLFNLPVNRTSVTAVLMNCSGNKLITCGLDDSVCVYQIMRGAGRQVETMFLERQIQNNTMICSIVPSMLQPELVFLGTKDGKIKLINIERGEAYKTYNVCNNAVIEMVVLQRQTKPQFPIAVCWPCGEECLKIVNTQSGKVANQATRGFIEFGCGIGPKSFFMNGGRSLGMLSQSKDKREVNIFRVQPSSN